MASTTDLVPVHPMETYRASKDYALFEAEKIRPFMRAAHDRAALFKESRLPLVVASGRPSIDNILNFLKETDYHNSLRSTNTPLPHSSSKVAPVDPHYFLEGILVRSSWIVLYGKVDSLRRVLPLFLGVMRG